MPEPAGIKFQCFGRNFMALTLFPFTPVTCPFLGLRQRQDNAELPSTGPERDCVEAPSLAETNLGCTKTYKRKLYVFA